MPPSSAATRRAPARLWAGVDEVGVAGRGIGEVDGEAVDEALVQAFGR